MSLQHYRRTVAELARVASKFWPTELADQEAELSIIPKLLETHESFIAILRVPVASVEKIFDIIHASTLSGNLFLKHLAVLVDFGGEMLQRINKQFAALFPEGVLTYFWRVNNVIERRVYQFQSLPVRSLDNKKLGLTQDLVLRPQPLSGLHQDVIALLLLGGAATDENVANVLARCEISNYLGQPHKLDKFLRERYIWVSNITHGAKSNTLGQLAQKFVQTYLESNLNVDGVIYQSNGHIRGIRHTDVQDGRETTFDLVLSLGNRHIAIEMSFQVTTNSVIERKAGQAQSRYEKIQALGHKIAYIIDGAGSFERQAALRTICAYSDCTVAFSRAELDVLCDFIREYFNHE